MCVAGWVQTDEGWEHIKVLLTKIFYCGGNSFTVNTATYDTTTVVLFIDVKSYGATKFPYRDVEILPWKT